MTTSVERKAPPSGIIPLLACLHCFAALTTDMYLPALPLLEGVFHTTTAEVQRTLTAFFLGFSFGQTLWGPITDRFGRRPPLYFSTLMFVAASVGCAVTTSIGVMSVLRVFQAVGACGGAVIARAMIRDMFPPEETRRAFSTLIGLNAVAPAVAPLIGGVLLTWFGWQSIFWTLALVGLAGLSIAYFVLPETLPVALRQPLHVGHVLRSYGGLLCDRTFLGSSLAAGLGSAGMFAYIAGSPFVFMKLHGVSPRDFGWIFGINAVGIMAGSYANSRYLNGFSADRLLKSANLLQFGAGLALVVAAKTGWGGVPALWIPLFLYVASIGVSFPNGSAIALAGHARIAGIASALLGTNQFGLATFSTAILSSIPNTTAMPMAAVICACGALAALINFTLLRNTAHRPPLVS